MNDIERKREEIHLARIPSEFIYESNKKDLRRNSLIRNVQMKEKLLLVRLEIER